ncbi:MAG TPA: nucleotide exchange factor GrpE [Kofleriaceae bacterium]|nr:nucleotide exchange factor GrpE [Kofleriaceae bacterium]
MEDDHFDAVAAARELEEALGDRTEPGAGGADRYVAMLESEIEALNKQIAAKEQKVKAAEIRAEMAAGDIARAEERIARESQRELARRSRALLTDMIGVIDDLERAVEASRAELDGSPFFEGMELVQRKFLAALAAHGVTPMAAAAGDRFDPAHHEAVGVVPAVDPAQDGTVVAVTQRGYLCGDETLRPAAVVVAKRG